jgi:hypothetical protein
MIKHDKCAEFEKRILDLENKLIDFESDWLKMRVIADKVHDENKKLKEENIILMAELDDIRKQLEKALV